MVANQYVRESPDVSNAPIRTLLTLDNGGNWELVGRANLVNTIKLGDIHSTNYAHIIVL